MEKTEIAAKRLTAKHVALILGGIAIIASAIVAAIFLTRSPTNIKDSQTPLGNLVVDADNVADIQSRMDEKVAKGMFETYMNTTWTFPDGESASVDAVMGNSANNNYPFRFEVTLRDGGETVYSSSLLPVGTEIKEIILSKDLDKGTYPAVVKIHMADETGEPVESNAGFNITLVIRN
jgi:hypothetical protein